MKCNICRKDYDPSCDYNQGRCPHHPPMLNIQPKDTSKGHFYVSLIKSGFRIGAGITLIQGLIVPAGALIILAEILSIVEELV